MSQYISPLRYPGGKAKLKEFLTALINTNKPIEVYVEPYAGGAGAALGLLFDDIVNEIYLNDVDIFITKFWQCVLYETDSLIKKIRRTPISIKKWKYYSNILMNKDIDGRSDLEIGFTTFYLNRCNRSGILTGGPIGGIDQESNWKIDARFNKENLIKRIKLIASQKSRIHFYNLDAIDFIEKCLNENLVPIKSSLFYLDPPYVKKGPGLYRKHYEEDDHLSLNEYLKKKTELKWVLSYDHTSFIEKLYKGIKQNGYEVNHFAHKAKIGKELIILSDKCIFPN